jgi:hypothetical protein
MSLIFRLSTFRQFQLVENKKDGIHEIVIYFKQGNGILSKVINAQRYKKAQQLAYKKLDRPIHVCHVHVPYRSAFLALKLKRQNNIPFVVTEHWSGHLTGEYQLKNATDKSILKSVRASVNCFKKSLKRIQVLIQSLSPITSNLQRSPQQRRFRKIS